MNSLMKRISFWKYRIITLLGWISNRLDANYEFKKWKRLKIPENEFDCSLTGQTFAHHLSPRQHAIYEKELFRRRRAAHERDFRFP